MTNVKLAVRRKSNQKGGSSDESSHILAKKSRLASAIEWLPRQPNEGKMAATQLAFIMA